jgi:plastocyanin
MPMTFSTLGVVTALSGLATGRTSYLPEIRTMRLSPTHSLLAGCLAAVLLVLSGAALAAEHVVAQKNKAFSMKKLTVKVGDTVKFVNEDSFAHNVFSLSAPKSFDLGSFGNGGSKSVTFDKPGKVEVECAVHPDMRLDVEVTP